ncbi:Mpv17/PMP22 family protein [Seiridium cupressi]
MPSPMIKATLYAATLSSTSNVLAQILDAYNSERPFVLDSAQFLRFVALAFLTAPPNYKWQQCLEHWFPSYERRIPLRDVESGRKDKDDDEKNEQREKIEAHENPRQHQPDPKQLKLNWRNTFAKWFIDCITIGAVLNTVAFFILMGVLKGQTTAQIGHNIRYETIPLIIAGFKIWPFASIVSFSCVPVEKRIIFLNFIGLLWGIYMSLVAARV